MTADPVLSLWEGAEIEAWRLRWQLPRVIALRETASTNDVVRRLAAEGAAAGLLVMTEYQSRGRGRMGRHWTAAPGDSLLLSFLLRPHPHAGDVAAGTAPVRVGIAIARALRNAASIDARLKWPNDIVVPGAGKLAGILCEAVSTGGEASIVAGIGINVRQQAHDWPDELRGHATSIAELAPGTAPDRAAIMDAITTAMRPLFTMALSPLSDEELAAYAAFDALRGCAVAATGGDEVRGDAAGIAPDGALLLETSRGMRRITSATVRVVASTPPHSVRSQR